MDLKEIINRLARKHGIGIMKAEFAANSQFSFIRSIIEKGTLETVYLPYLGKILVKPKRKAILIQYNELKRRQLEAGEHPTGLYEFIKIQRGNRELGKPETKSV